MLPPRPRTREIIDPNYPLLHARATSIRSVKQETFTYGSTEVHKLDVYYPPPSSWTKDPPHQPLVLVFFHGGGLTHGSRSSPPSYLVHNNLGAFFASRGILTVIPDYRLVPSITFPQGSEDVRDALEWVISNLSPKSPPVDSNATTDRSGCHLFILGHSAGGTHVLGFLLTSLFRTAAFFRQALRGVGLLGVSYDVQRSRPSFRAAAQQYYGHWKNVSTRQPLGLLQSAQEEDVAALPPVRNMVAESEPRSVSGSTGVFIDMFREKGGRITHHVLPGHDHASPVLALSSGSGEEWGEDLETWMRQLISTQYEE